MAEKVVSLKLERDYKKYIYYLSKGGDVMRSQRATKGTGEVLVPNAVTRDNNFLYFIDKDGDVSRSRRVQRGDKHGPPQT